ncbi:MAG TPA: hypothetical protein ENI51_04805, partial [Candidatus Atribacteria bacterium]|nr:hypothetical protein [Candidatus Atribacteria bacterium]
MNKKVIGVFIWMLLISTTIAVIVNGSIEDPKMAVVSKGDLLFNRNSRIYYCPLDTYCEDIIQKQCKENSKLKTNYLTGYTGKTDWFEVIDQEQGKSNYFLLFIKKGRQFAQSFTPSISPLSKVELRLYAHNATGDFHFAIRQELDGSDLVYQSRRIENSFGDWIVFDFDDINVTVDSKYYIV